MHIFNIFILTITSFYDNIILYTKLFKTSLNSFKLYNNERKKKEQP